MSDETRPPDEVPDATGTAPKYDVAGAALGALSPEELADIRAASQTDALLWKDLTSMEATAAELARLAPTMQINRGRSAGIRSRLTSRAAASREGRSSLPRAVGDLVKPPAQHSHSPSRPPITQTPVPATHSMPHPPQRVAGQRATGESPGARAPQRSQIGLWHFLAAVSVLACVAMGTQLYRTVRDRDALREVVTLRDGEESAKIASLQGAIAGKDSVIASLTGPQMRVVDLMNYTSQEPAARMFWDRKSQEWMMYAYNLRQPKPGKTFQVWLMASGKPAPISAGTFRPDSTGAAIMRAKYSMDRGALRRIVISEEPDGGMPYPTGPFVLAGR